MKMKLFGIVFFLMAFVGMGAQGANVVNDPSPTCANPLTVNITVDDSSLNLLLDTVNLYLTPHFRNGEKGVEIRLKQFCPAAGCIRKSDVALPEDPFTMQIPKCIWPSSSSDTDVVSLSARLKYLKPMGGSGTVNCSTEGSKTLTNFPFTPNFANTTQQITIKVSGNDSGFKCKIIPTA